MKNKSVRLLELAIACSLIFTCCKKVNEPALPQPIWSPPQPQQTIANVNPVANAGPDIYIGQAPCASLHWTELDGSGSYDSDDSITYYEWKNISGPLPVIVSNNGNAKAIALDIRAGLYAFELLVKDSRGSSSRDTVFVDARNWVQQDHDLDITVEGTYSYYDNLYDDFDGSYQDVIIISGIGNFAPIGQFALDLYESADTATISSWHGSSFQLSAAGSNNSFLHIPFIRGQSSVFFKQIIQNGGGAFTGTFKVIEGTAWPCNASIYSNLVPLTISGNVDTTAHTINLNIKGKTFF